MKYDVFGIAKEIVVTDYWIKERDDHNREYESKCDVVESTTEHLFCVCPGCGMEILDDDLDYDDGDNGFGAGSLPEAFNCGHCSEPLNRDDIKFPDQEY